jgi:endonuclease/exonuclease/phosphatase family metal-dependent hydrolase
LGFVTWTIPLFILANFVLLANWAYRQQLRFLIPLIALIISWGHTKALFQITFFNNTAKGIKILSYNTQVFKVYAHLGKKENWKSTKSMTQWIVDKDFDIMCFQEFYYEPSNPTFNTIKKLKAKNKYYHYFYKTLSNRVNGQFGMAVFSKYKIINYGKVAFDKKSNNQIIYVDLEIKGDTLRVYNGHLVSNNIEDQEVPDTEVDAQNKAKLKSLIKDLKGGFAKRGDQVDALMKSVKACPYKIIFCGDLNDLPYSYTYTSIKSELNNAFEKKGNGFGISHNGKIPFLRIDNIFVSDEITVNSFTTHKSVKYSDHFPISSTISIK